MKNLSLILDFDSTLVTVESLDLLVQRACGDDPSVAASIEEITSAGMEGRLPIRESITRRVKLIKADRTLVNEVAEEVARSVTASFLRNKPFLTEHRDHIWVISGGFRELLLPTIVRLGLREDHLIANSFTFSKRGQITGCDLKHPLLKEGGKGIVLRSLGLRGKVVVIGDGWTDYEMKLHGGATEFLAFTEVVTRSPVVDVADDTIGSFDEFLFREKLPRALSFPKSKLRVLLLEGIDSEAAARFEREGFAVETMKGALDEGELERALPEISILGIRSKSQLYARALRGAKRLLTVGTFCIGTDQVDLERAAHQGVAVFNAPFSNTRSVVELAIGSIIMLLRRALVSNAKLHAGIWEKSAAGCFEVRGRTLGIVGYGNIGAQLSVVAESLGMKVLYYDLVEKLSLGNAERCATLEDLLKRSEIVTVHVDGRRENKQLFGAKEFALMKRGSYFLNLARGGVVQVPALAEALKHGHLAGAAVDVFPYEPKSNDEPFSSELCGLENVILTPHIGGSTKEAQRRIADYVTDRLLHYVNSGASMGAVNMPNVQLPPLADAHRFLHIHANVPGILAEVNAILARRKLNILGQYLKTDERVGYVITDVNRKYDARVIEELKGIGKTIRFRAVY